MAMKDKAQISAEMLILLAIIVAAAALASSSIQDAVKQINAKFESELKSALKAIK